METIVVDSLTDSTCAVTSGETFDLVLRQRDLICASDGKSDNWNNYLRKFWYSGETTKSQIAAVEFLGRLVLYDFVAIEDTSALDKYEARERDTDWLTLIKKVAIPESVYEMAGNLATDAFDLRNTRWEKKSEYDVIEKRHLERLAERGVRIREALRNSDYPGIRLYFYIVLSAIYRVPLVLDFNKNEALEHFASDFRNSVRDTYAKIEQELADPIRKKLKEKLNEIGEEIPLQLPPLVNYIFKIADKHKLSLWDATLKIRETSDAQAFRKYLHELERARASDSVQGILTYQKQLQKIHDLGLDWAENLNTSYQITKATSPVPVRLNARLLNLGTFNTLSELDKREPLRNTEYCFPGILHAPEPHLVFLSKLFE